MSDRPRRPQDPFAAAEAVFAKKRAPDPKQSEDRKKPGLPNAKELISIRVDRDVIEHFQADGPGWQDRMSDALRSAAIASGLEETSG